jgi:hypothetical protein
MSEGDREAIERARAALEEIGATHDSSIATRLLDGFSPALGADSPVAGRSGS